MILTYAQENLSQTLKRADVIYFPVEHASEKVDRLILFTFGYQHVDTPVDLLGSAVEIADLQEPSADLKQIVITIAIEFDQAEKSPLCVIHHSRGQVSATEYCQQLDIARVAFEGLAKHIDRAIGLALLSVDGRNRRQSLPAVGVDHYGLQIGIQSLLGVAFSKEF